MNCFMVKPNEEFTGLLELSISGGEIDIMENVGMATRAQRKSLHWPQVFLALDTNALQNEPQPSATILPLRPVIDITNWPLECSFDIVSAIVSGYKKCPQWSAGEDSPWSTGFPREVKITPSVLNSKLANAEYELETNSIKFTATSFTGLDSNNTPGMCCLVIDVTPAID